MIATVTMEVRAHDSGNALSCWGRRPLSVAKLRALASVAPLASIFTGLLLALSGILLGESDRLQAGWGFVTAGMALQAIYLLARHVR